MSNAQENHTKEHQSLIKTPKQLITVVALSIIVPVIIIFMLAAYVASGTRVGAGSQALTTESIDRRIAPVAGFELVDANAPREFLTGEAVYKQVCAACHAAGVAGAPRVGDNATWAPLIDTGLDNLVQIAIHGKGAMPPKGGAANLSDFEVTRAVVYMTNESGGSFPEPEEPAAEGEGEGAAAEAQAAPAAQPQQAAAPAAQQQAQQQEQAPAQPPAAEAQGGAQQQAAAGIPISEEAHTIGKKLYETTCATCHGTGVAGAPKLGDKADWAPYVATGMDTMLQVAIKGKGAMPPRGTAMNASDDELRAAIEYMIADAQ